MEEEIYRLNVTTSEGKFNLTNLDFKDPLSILLFRQTMYKQMGSKAHFYLKVSNRGISNERMELMISSIQTAVSKTIFFSEIPLVIGSLRIVEYDPEEAVARNLPNIHRPVITKDPNEEPLLAYKATRTQEASVHVSFTLSSAPMHIFNPASKKYQMQIFRASWNTLFDCAEY